MLGGIDMTIKKSRVVEAIKASVKRMNEARLDKYLRPFEDRDWDAYSGAVELPGSIRPMIYEDPDYEFVVILSGSDDGKNCVITVLPNETEEYVYYTPTNVNASIAEANHLIDDLIEEGDRIGYITNYLREPESGFERML